VSLRSVDGKSQPIYDSGNLYIEPQDGNSIKLTIDATIQEICEKAMRECYDVNKAQAVHLIAMDPYTGSILAMCSKPDYDPNDPPRDQPDALTRLMRIRLISDAYEPGSTFKILTAAAALPAHSRSPVQLRPHKSPAPSSSALPGFSSRLFSPICRVQLPSLTSRKVHVSSSAVSSSLLPFSRTVSAFTFAWIFSRSAFILRILSGNSPPGSRESAFPHDTTSAPWGQDKLTGGYFA